MALLQRPCLTGHASGLPLREHHRLQRMLIDLIVKDGFYWNVESGNNAGLQLASGLFACQLLSKSEPSFYLRRGPMPMKTVPSRWHRMNE